MTTILNTSGKPYMTIENREQTVAIRLHTNDIWLKIDKKHLPEIIATLSKIMESENGTSEPLLP